MPYSSDKQRSWMYANKPEIAKRWDKEGKNYVKKKAYSKEAIEYAKKMKG